MPKCKFIPIKICAKSTNRTFTSLKIHFSIYSSRETIARHHSSILGPFHMQLLSKLSHDDVSLAEIVNHILRNLTARQTHWLHGWFMASDFALDLQNSPEQTYHQELLATPASVPPKWKSVCFSFSVAFPVIRQPSLFPSFHPGGIVNKQWLSSSLFMFGFCHWVSFCIFLCLAPPKCKIPCVPRCSAAPVTWSHEKSV